MNENRRLYPHAAVNAAARVRTGSSELRCRVVDLSAHGMALETGREEKLGHFVRITADFEGDLSRVDVDAIVQNRQNTDDKCRWGVEFHQPRPGDVSRIADYVRQRTEMESPAEEPEVLEPEATPASSERAHSDDPEVQRLFEEALRNLG